MLVDRKRAAAIMEERGLDFLLATRPENVYYASGHFSQNQWYVTRWTQVYALIPRDPGAPMGLVLPVNDAGPVAEYLPPDPPVELYGEYFVSEGPGPLRDPVDQRLKQLALDSPRHRTVLDALARLLERFGAMTGTIGVDEQGMDPALMEEARGRLPSVSFSRAWEVFREIRQVKGSEEIRRLREAVRIIEAAMEAALRMACPGATERDLHLEFEATIARMGGRPNYTILSFGERGARGNVFGSDRTLRRGDLIRFDIGCWFQGYYSDIARNAILGEPSLHQRTCYDAILAGHRAALAMVRPGAMPKGIFEVGMAAARQAGLPHLRRHHVGHGIGLDFYEPPLLGPATEKPLVTGMVVNVEIPYYEIGEGGFQVEDTVVVTETGCELLTRSPMELRILA
ncbi:MAG: hypothetical protein A3G35_16145 [candidate division NC10 bacterium RIFCSPLOWO2_12_FULL_66_18]|nr:MAG: hypothetical protein A3G35_16145 [candidate division NC10 bacterium RIFCSPLOWO2_12_FULL_66_18]